MPERMDVRPSGVFAGSIGLERRVPAGWVGGPGPATTVREACIAAQPLMPPIVIWTRNFWQKMYSKRLGST